MLFSLVGVLPWLRLLKLDDTLFPFIKDEENSKFKNNILKPEY
jgi:hypothetical protein